MADLTAASAGISASRSTADGSSGSTRSRPSYARWTIGLTSAPAHLGRRVDVRDEADRRHAGLRRGRRDRRHHVAVLVDRRVGEPESPAARRRDRAAARAAFRCSGRSSSSRRTACRSGRSGGSGRGRWSWQGSDRDQIGSSAKATSARLAASMNVACSSRTASSSRARSIIQVIRNDDVATCRGDDAGRRRARRVPRRRFSNDALMPAPTTLTAPSVVDQADALAEARRQLVRARAPPRAGSRAR